MTYLDPPEPVEVTWGETIEIVWATDREWWYGAARKVVRG